MNNHNFNDFQENQSDTYQYDSMSEDSQEF